MLEAELTWTWEGPSWVLSRSRAVLAALQQELEELPGSVMPRPAYVSFSKVTDADFGASTASDEGVTEIDVIFPL